MKYKNIKVWLLTCVLFCFASFGTVYAQSVGKADRAFDKMNYHLALSHYVKILPTLKDKKEIAYISYRIAECYRYSLKYQEAIVYYKKAVDGKYKDETNTMYSNYGDMLMMAGDYKLAQKMYKTHLVKNKKDNLTQKKIQSCVFADTSKSNVDKFELRNIQELNTKFNEFAPSKFKKKVVFSSSRFNKDSLVYTYTGDGFEDLYETSFNENANVWFAPRMLAGINTSFNDGTFTYDAQRNIAYVMQCNGKKGEEKNCNIYTSTYIENSNSWTQPKRFQYFSKSYSSGHPALSEDGKTLYFASNNPVGIGGTDIWFTVLDTVSQNWSKPEILKGPINSIADEMFPFVYNKKLYFSSNGLLGYGGLDIYQTEINNGASSQPVNLQSPFNSSADDFSIIFTGENTGIFASSRPGGVGGDDLYFFDKKNIEIIASGKVTDENYVPIQHVLVIIKNVKKEITDTLLTDVNGLYEYKLMEQNQEYTVTVSKSGYFNQDSRIVSTSGIKKSTLIDSVHGVNLNFVLKQMLKNNEYEIKDIYYDLDKYSLRQESEKELNNLVNILNNNPEICVQLNSHTDTRASDEYNIELSHNRAKSVVDYLILKGIDKKRLAWQGWGETKLKIAEAKTEEEHQANRRTTFTIVNFDQLHLGEKAENHNKLVARIEKIKAPQKSLAKGVYFRIQVSASRKSCDETIFDKVKAKYPKLICDCTQNEDGFYRYSVGVFKTFGEAEQAKQKVDALGYSSFLIAYDTGEKITISEALKRTRPVLSEKDLQVEIQE